MVEVEDDRRRAGELVVDGRGARAGRAELAVPHAGGDVERLVVVGAAVPVRRGDVDGQLACLGDVELEGILHAVAPGVGRAVGAAQLGGRPGTGGVLGGHVSGLEVADGLGGVASVTGIAVIDGRGRRGSRLDDGGRRGVALLSACCGVADRHGDGRCHAEHEEKTRQAHHELVKGHRSLLLSVGFVFECCSMLVGWFVLLRVIDSCSTSWSFSCGIHP